MSHKKYIVKYQIKTTFEKDTQIVDCVDYFYSILDLTGDHPSIIQNETGVFFYKEDSDEFFMTRFHNHIEKQIFDLTGKKEKLTDVFFWL